MLSEATRKLHYMSFHHARNGVSAAALVALVTALALTGCQAATQTGSDGARADGIIHVPAEVPTLTAAEQLAKPGDVIQIAAGTYDEQLLISTPDITVRGEDRNATIIDGGGVRPYGIVAMADGVRVENLTVANATFYGLLFTGLHDKNGPSAPTANNYEQWDPKKFPPLQRFLADHVTAVNNGLYGIYAFNSQHGEIRDSYASGSADSGLYVGQCSDCDILVAGNVAERNAVGFENSNASDSVVLAGNRLSGNRIGLTLLSSYQEAFLPQKGNTVVGNLISNNAAAETPAQASGGFGTGIGISGGVGNLIERNTITGNPRAGVILNNAEDLAPYGNALVDNTFADNLNDVVNASADRASASANCVAGGTFTALPEALHAQLMSATSCAPSLKEATAQAAAQDPGGPAAPAGISFRKVAWPRPQPNLDPKSSYPKLPGTVTMPDLSSVSAPGADFLAKFSGQR